MTNQLNDKEMSTGQVRQQSHAHTCSHTFGVGLCDRSANVNVVDL